MLKIEDIKPIPKYMLKLIQKQDKQHYPTQNGCTRFYSYLTKFSGELVNVTVACRNKGKNWYCKQVAIHDIHSPYCLVKDITFFYVGGYVVDWHEQGLTKYSKWWSYGSWDTAYSKYFNMYSPIINIEYVLKIPQYKYSAVDLYKYTNILKYLKCYEVYPQAELLVKFGLSKYATSRQILRATSKDKNFGKWLIRNSKEISTHDYYVSTLLKAYKTRKPFEIVQQIENVVKNFKTQNTPKCIRALFKTDKEILTFLEYIKKQETHLSSYADYLQACNYLGLDMSQNKNRFPHDFKRWHDIRIDEYRTAKALKDEQERKELYIKFASIAEKYLPLQRDKNDTYVVVIARSPADLIREGETLHHCVGSMNYDQRMIREESLIFFIRDKNSPDVPFVTVEYSLKQHKVLQCYGDRDSKPNEQVLNFVNKKWLPYANRKLKQIA
ncbi:MAG: PcfJ domain-containing protein [Clostridia bacterium]|nr:PcfJ domain-containing protein [Clostridia bacterium]